jgi:ankyrin repeat protein
MPICSAILTSIHADDERTALHLAASHGHSDVMNYLLQTCSASIHVNALDRMGGTPLDDAKRHEMPVSLLVPCHPRSSEERY